MSYPPPPAFPAAFPPPPPPPPPSRGKTIALIAGISVLGLLVVTCGIVAAINFGRPERPRPQAAAPLRPATGSSLPAIDDSGDQHGASPLLVTDENQFDDVCSGTFYPKSPKFTGKGPHPIAFSVKDRKDMESRTQHSIYRGGYPRNKPLEDAWDSDKQPGKVQLVACVDLVATGTTKLKTCKFDDPKPDSLPLEQGYYQLSLFEAATGKKLVSKRVNGDDHECPTFVLLGSDHTLYTGITDDYYVQLLKPYVEKK